MAMTLTASQMFLGALSIGIGMFRGTEAFTSFHHRHLVGQATYAAAKISTDHARAANCVVNDNVIMAAIMGPRFGVESDNICMDANAEIACPTCPRSSICKVCKQYKANKPRAAAKQEWVRANQKRLWGILGKLSGEIDKMASMQADGLVTKDIQNIDSQIKVSFDDPSRSQQIWGGQNAGVACKLGSKDILPSPVTGHAFPLLINPNLLEGLPKTLVQAMPQMICAVTSAASGGGGGGGGGGGSGSGTASGALSTDANGDGQRDVPKLSMVPSVSDKTRDECRDYEKQMRCAIAAAKGEAGNCGDYDGPRFADLSDSDATESYAAGATGTKRVEFPSKVQPYVKCQTATVSSPLQDTSAGGYWYRNKDRQIVTCTFDRDKCEDERLTENSDDYLRDKLGLPKMVSNLASILGGSETRKPTQGGSSPKNFCACGKASKEVDERIIRMSDAVREIASFGTSQQSQALRKQRQYKACGRWYFPDRKGQFTSTPKDEQPFVGAWKWGQQMECEGGGS